MHYKVFQDEWISELSNSYDRILLVGQGNWDPIRIHFNKVDSNEQHDIYTNDNKTIYIGKKRLQELDIPSNTILALSRVLEHLEITDDILFDTLSSKLDAMYCVVPDMKSCLTIYEKTLQRPYLTFPLMHATYQIVPEYEYEADRHKWFTTHKSIHYVPYFKVHKVDTITIHGFKHLNVLYKPGKNTNIVKQIPLDFDFNTSLSKYSIRNLDWEVFKLIEQYDTYANVEINSVGIINKVIEDGETLEGHGKLIDIFKNSQSLMSPSLMRILLAQEKLLRDASIDHENIENFMYSFIV